MRILVAGPDESLVEEMRDLSDLAGQGHQYIQFSADAVESLAWAEYDALLLNFIEPDIRALELVRSVRHHAPDLPALVISWDAPSDFKISALRLGADDYVTRPFDPGELVARIQAVCRRTGRRTPREENYGDLRLDPVSRSASVNDRPIPLAGREYEVLELLTGRHGDIVSKEALLRHLYDDKTPSGGEVIRVFIHNLRKKLEQAGSAQVINTCRGRGYMLSGGDHQQTAPGTTWHTVPVETSVHRQPAFPTV
jgi:two-component system cell cycle response regulator CtrA